MVRKRHQRILALLAVFAMLFDSIPVSTVADEAGGAAPVCGMEEHRHTDGCYQDDELICGKKEHTHTDACYPAPEPEPAKEEPAPVVVTDFQDKVKEIVMTKPIGTSKKVVALLKEYGWSKVREVPEEKQEEFLQKVEAL